MLSLSTSPGRSAGDDDDAPYYTTKKAFGVREEMVGVVGIGVVVGEEESEREGGGAVLRRRAANNTQQACLYYYVTGCAKLPSSLLLAKTNKMLFI